jgi:hypothetical protein
MSIEDDQLDHGSLTVGPKGSPVLTLSCQVTKVSLEPKTNESGDKIATLCGDELSTDVTTDWSLKFTGVQDWGNKTGFINYAFDHDGEIADFEFSPKADKGPTWSGKVQIRAVVIGGDVKKRITSDAEWPCQGKPTRTDPATAASAASAGASGTSGTK